MVVSYKQLFRTFAIVQVQILLWTAALVEAADLEDVIDIWFFKGGSVYNFDVYDIPSAVNKLEVSSAYNRSKPLVMLLHGAHKSANTVFVKTMIDAFEVGGRAKEFNLLVIDGPEPPKPQGPQPTKKEMVGKIISLGERIGAFLNEAIGRGLTAPERIHLIGFSNGAHLAGYVARTVKAVNGQIASITALDPARSGFETVSSEKTGAIHVSATDATATHVLHTNAYLQGSKIYSGSADFVFNNGIIQPGCFTTNRKDRCSHGRAVLYLAEMIKEKFEQFVGRQCANWWSFETCRCENNPDAELTFPPKPTVYGVYYMTTYEKSSFSRSYTGSHCPLLQKV